jgi:ATP-dependent RNA circularization protein (DNA/RNA ligase family)
MKAALLEGEMKKDILLAANYRYNFDRDVYFNRAVKKAFSLEFVEDHSEDELKKSLGESTASNGWKFYFNSVPSENVKRELERVLDGRAHS